jgi:IPT/TIG domain
MPGTLATVVCLAIAPSVSCLPGAGPAIMPYQDDAAPASGIMVGDDAGSFSDVDLGDPFAVTGLQPSHGPWTGGTRTTIAGRGFSSSLEVWIGGVLLDGSDVFASTPTRVAVVTPSGAPGAADVTIRNETTAQERTLAAGFFFDAFAVSPSGGATTGGTRITLRGSGTHWAADSSVTVGGQPCVALQVVDATDLACTTPAGSPGTQDVTVANADGTIDQARDAFTYSDSPDGYRGGLYGGALSGALEVLAFDALTGTPLTGGQAIAGSTLATAVVGTIDGSGAARLSAPSLTGKITVTVAAKCHQPITFVDVPVDTVTAYLSPELDLSCAGDPPSSGSYYGAQGGEIDGELVWPGGIEFTRSGWTNVPLPQGSNERQAAYVFTAVGSPLDTFALPAAGSATTPDDGGQLGYTYALGSLAGNQTVYALAGIEDRSVDPPTFVPYAMGIARGVFVQPGAKTVGVDIPMTTPLDHALTTNPQPPVSAPRGPDRLVSNVAMDLGAGLFAVLPQGSATTFLPVSGAVSFVGVPSLDGTLAGASYDLAAAAVSGASGGPPISVVAGIETTNANVPVTVGGFFALPVLAQPSTATWTGTHVTLQASGPVDLAVVDVSSGNGLVTWQIVAPGTSITGGTLSFDLPDLAQVPGVGALVHGPITTSFAIARIGSFDYGLLRYGQLSSAAWSAYASDTTSGSY